MIKNMFFYIVVTFVSYHLFWFVYQHWFYKKDYSKFKKEWAIVTGASYGIGKSVAIALAKRGINVMLLARSKDKLEKVASEVESYGVKSKIFAVDLSDKNTFKKIATELQEATILINNVGGLETKKQFNDFLFYTDEDFQYQFNLNFFSTVETCRICLPSMVQKKRGVILNVSSVASKIPYWLSPYSSAKNALNGFSHALHREYKPHGIDVHTLLIGMVDTPLNEKLEKSSPEIVGKL
jgi:short-subunit dehydrogenase